LLDVPLSGFPFRIACVINEGMKFRLKLLLGLAALLVPLLASAATNINRKALVIGEGDAPGAGLGHPQAAKNNFLRYVGNPSNDPAKGWTCDLSWDLMTQLGMDPKKTTLEELFAYIGKHKLGYRIAMRNFAHTANDSFWAAAVDNGIMPFAPHGDNTDKHIDRPLGLQPCVAVAGGRAKRENTYGPSLEFFEAVPSGPGGLLGEDTAQSWANQMLAAKFAKILDRHPDYNIWDARQHLRQAASHWDKGWTERDGYGRVNLNARVGKLSPAPPIAFQAVLARNGRQVHFIWRNFAMSDFAATVIATADGRILYDGGGTNFTWTTGTNVPAGFVYWSKNKAGEKSRIESYQRRTVPGLSYAGKPSCLILADPGDRAPGAIEMAGVFQAAATNWVCDIACRPGTQLAQWAGLYGVFAPYVAAFPDFSAMVDYAISNRYQLILVPADETENPDLSCFNALWDRAVGAGVAVVVPHSGLWPETPAKALLPSPAQLGSAITVTYAEGTNILTRGPGLEFTDAAVSPPNVQGAYVYSANAAAATLAARFARAREAYPGFNLWDIRQLLRQTSSHYQDGWSPDCGYGTPAITSSKRMELELAPPLEIQVGKAEAGKAVVFSWLNFQQTDFACTIIRKADGTQLYAGQGSNFTWHSDLTGDATFKFHTRGKSGRLSRDAPYTVIHLEGLQPGNAK
jgi:hypothetical protein